MSNDEIRGLKETLHLLRSPRNAQRLLRSIEQLQSDGGEEGNILIEDTRALLTLSAGKAPPGRPKKPGSS